MTAKIASYTLLILKDGSEIDFESSICLAEKKQKKTNLPMKANLTIKFQLN